MWGYIQGYEYRDNKFYKAGTNTEIASGGFAWTNYTKFGTKTDIDPDYGFTKYNSSGPATLEPIDDAATIEWGSGWRMPKGGANGEFETLYDNCVRTWNTELGGYLVTGKGEYAGISVFFPALTNAGSEGNGHYWSSSLSYDLPNVYNSTIFQNNAVGKGSTERWKDRLDFDFIGYLTETIVLVDPLKDCVCLGWPLCR